MGSRTKFCLTLFLVSVLILCAGLALAKTDPELKQCKHQCKVQRQYDEEQKEQCAKGCEKYYKEKKGREQEEEEEEEWGSGRGRGDEFSTHEPGEKRLSQCMKQCERQDGGQQKQLCRFRCQEKYKKERREHSYSRDEEEEEEGDEEQEEEDENPYVFEDEHFTTRVKTEQGKVVVLPKFTKRSKLLRGLEKYRLAFLVANPQAFVVPNHMDADSIFFVSWGRGTITKIRENKRESMNVKQGDIIRIRAGTPFYIVNTDENEKLYIVKLLQPVNLPGHYEVFHGPGGENPESFYRAFSREVLEAALKTPRDKLEKLFEKQDEGAIVKASKEQIRAMSRRGEGPSIWPFTGKSTGTFNLFKKDPSQSNNYGQLFESEFKDYPPLQELDIMVSYVNITKGGMSGPFYNSRATKIAIVVSGEGRLEIACPHLSSSKNSGQEKSGPSYKKLSSSIRTDSVFVVPAGHPFVTVASGNQNLEILCFEVNAEGNIRYTLAGKKNIIEVMEKEAKELAFKTKGEEVDKVFGKQDEEFFFQGPKWRQHQQGRADE
uniref:Vicilin Pis v 3.0101 n=1 Tax=Pistacia vera TaxID=55513 RepID=VCL_PISVE|nr:RecName: Full=Vicilin Pis v 3.0101; AltName: Full=7S globulin; AltName: Full=7S seed storage protein; AltName: Full=7S vicilin-like protein Pis v 3; AltName: Full=Vicilin Pis v 3; AltName: Allergen=Pis v 3.0101; Flags: Precursor [Pistacia vera]